MTTSITLRLPMALKRWLEEEAEAKGKKDKEEYVRDLLQREKRRQARKRIEDALEESLDGRKPEPLTESLWKRIQADAKKKAQALKSR